MRMLRAGLLRVASVCAAGLAVLAGPLEAQDEPERLAGRGFFQPGYIRLDLDELNASLQSAGFPTFERDVLTLGGAGYGTRGRFLIGGEGHALLGGSESTIDGAREVSFGGGYGLFRVGYLAFSRRGFDVFPTFGIGGGGLSLTISERSAPTFHEVLADPATSSRLSTGFFMLDAGLALNYRVLAGEDDGGGFLVGLQGGYAFAPGSTSWMLNEINDVAGGPEFQIEGPYVRLSIGGWGREDAEDTERRRRRRR